MFQCWSTERRKDAKKLFKLSQSQSQGWKEKEKEKETDSYRKRGEREIRPNRNNHTINHSHSLAALLLLHPPRVDLSRRYFRLLFVSARFASRVWVGVGVRWFFLPISLRLRLSAKSNQLYGTGERRETTIEGKRSRQPTPFKPAHTKDKVATSDKRSNSSTRLV